MCLLFWRVLLWGFGWTSCKLPFRFPHHAEPSGGTIGPRNTLIVPSDDGPLFFCDLKTYSVRADVTLRDDTKYKESYGWFDFEGLTMTNPESTFVYAGLENKPIIVEYEWHSARRIFRRFDLPDFDRAGNRGLESVTWVPTRASSHQGYFYVGSQMTGFVFIYELPILSDTGPEAQATLIKKWQPISDTDLSGMACSENFLFLNYDDGEQNHVLIYPILENGLPGDLLEEYMVDVSDAEGIAVRKIDATTWEAFFSSDSMEGIFGYLFKFGKGFSLHPHCAHPAASSAITNGAAWTLLFWIMTASM